MNIEQLEIVSLEKQVKYQKLKKFLKYLATLVTGEKQRRDVNSAIDNKTWAHLPIFMISMTIFQISVYFYYEIRYYYSYYGCLRSVFTSSPTIKYEIWRILTHGFLHFSRYHLLKNMSAQIIFGIPQEIAFSYIYIAPLYSGGIMFSEIFMNAIRKKENFTCGASGGDFALIFAQVSNLILNYKDISYNHLQAIWIFIHIFSDFGEDLYYILTHGKGVYAHGHHIFSAIYGLIYGFCILHYNKKTRNWNIVRFIFLSIYFSCLIVAIFKYYVMDL
ncbi:unnamed protein product [Caenorhabditis angaria]|uniref:Peptidase S54 rhomboid domain-containing protein n=1 Tax=Caenorhabditis angaria TaxID=860376 RepID=A0A9P1J291_9PELO|nr:unnamed protein product [Caenorhabditis angaria]